MMHCRHCLDFTDAVSINDTRMSHFLINLQGIWDNSHERNGIKTQEKSLKVN